MASGRTRLFDKKDAMKTVDLKQRTAAVASAISITFAIVWTLSSYAYGGPPVGLTDTISKTASIRTCS